MIWQLIAALLGVAVMSLPGILQLQPPLAEADWIIGPIIAAVAIVSAAGVLRSLRWANVINAIALALSGIAWGSRGSAIFHGAIAAILVFISIPKGSQRHSYGSGWGGLLADSERGHPS